MLKLKVATTILCKQGVINLRPTFSIELDISLIEILTKEKIQLYSLKKVRNAAAP